MNNSGSRTNPRRAARLTALAVSVVFFGACTAQRETQSSTARKAQSNSKASAPKAVPTSYVTPGKRLGVGPCPLYPADNVFHATVSKLPLRSDSRAVINSLGGKKITVRPAFSSGVWEGSRTGVPINVVDSRRTPVVDVVGGTYAYISDLTAHPVPKAPRFEGWPGIAWDRHLLVVDTATCTTSEFFYVTPPWVDPAAQWNAETAVKIDLESNTPRSAGAATASGTSMLAGLVRYDEVAAGKIDHVVGIAVPKIKAVPPVWPATGTDGRSNDANAPAMGTWLRLRADIDMSRFGPQARVVARALQDHGALILDTNHNDIALGGEPDERWDDKDLATLTSLSAADFDVVDPTPMKISDDSYRIR